MQPVCDALNLKESRANRIQNIFLATYHYVNQLYPKKHLFTPRNLHMMIMRYVGSNNPYIAAYFALEYFRAKGFVDATKQSREEAEKNNNSPAKRYYHIQASDIEDIKNVLIKAFHEGAIVIIDEINTMQLEHLLNALLSGKTPDGKKAEHPGFLSWAHKTLLILVNAIPYLMLS